ncbi:hypothetical protein CLOP_g23591 [Closterium sp. NIES-67]|nr:hypothetical protein CLOP_g23591 [Closterium sp. NIES-67]
MFSGSRKYGTPGRRPSPATARESSSPSQSPAGTATAAARAASPIAAAQAAHVAAALSAIPGSPPSPSFGIGVGVGSSSPAASPSPQPLSWHPAYQQQFPARSRSPAGRSPSDRSRQAPSSLQAPAFHWSAGQGGAEPVVVCDLPKEVVAAHEEAVRSHDAASFSAPRANLDPASGYAWVFLSHRLFLWSYVASRVPSHCIALTLPRSALPGSADAAGGGGAGGVGGVGAGVGSGGGGRARGSDGHAWLVGLVPVFAGRGEVQGGENRGRSQGMDVDGGEGTDGGGDAAMALAGDTQNGSGDGVTGGASSRLAALRVVACNRRTMCVAYWPNALPAATAATTAAASGSGRASPLEPIIGKAPEGWGVGQAGRKGGSFGSSGRFKDIVTSMVVVDATKGRGKGSGAGRVGDGELPDEQQQQQQQQERAVDCIAVLGCSNGELWRAECSSSPPSPAAAAATAATVTATDPSSSSSSPPALRPPVAFSRLERLEAALPAASPSASAAAAASRGLTPGMAPGSLSVAAVQSLTVVPATGGGGGRGRGSGEKAGDLEMNKGGTGTETGGTVRRSKRLSKTVGKQQSQLQKEGAEGMDTDAGAGEGDAAAVGANVGASAGGTFDLLLLTAIGLELWQISQEPGGKGRLIWAVDLLSDLDVQRALIGQKRTWLLDAQVATDEEVSFSLPQLRSSLPPIPQLPPPSPSPGQSPAPFSGQGKSGRQKGAGEGRGPETPGGVMTRRMAAKARAERMGGGAGKEDEQQQQQQQREKGDGKRGEADEEGEGGVGGEEGEEGGESGMDVVVLAAVLVKDRSVGFGSCFLQYWLLRFAIVPSSAPAHCLPLNPKPLCEPPPSTAFAAPGNTAAYSEAAAAAEAAAGGTVERFRLRLKQAPLLVVPRAKVEEEEAMCALSLRLGGRPRGSVLILSGDGAATLVQLQEGARERQEGSGVGYGQGSAQGGGQGVVQKQLYQLDPMGGMGRVLAAGVFRRGREEMGDEEEGEGREEVQVGEKGERKEAQQQQQVGDWLLLTERRGVCALPMAVVDGRAGEGRLNKAPRPGELYGVGGRSAEDIGYLEEDGRVRGADGGEGGELGVEGRKSMEGQEREGGGEEEREEEEREEEREEEEQEEAEEAEEEEAWEEGGPAVLVSSLFDEFLSAAAAVGGGIEASIAAAADAGATGITGPGGAAGGVGGAGGAAGGGGGGGLTGADSGSRILQRMLQAGAFEAEGESSPFVRCSLSIIDALTKHWGADEPTTGPATTAGLRTPSSAARGAEERGGGTAREGGQGGVAAGGFSSSGKLGVKQWQHDRFLEFLQASGAQQELAVRQPLALQLILEHGERLAAVAHLRTLHSSLAATASNLQQQLQQQHQQQMQRQGSPSPFASPYLQSPAPKAASPLPQTPTSASAAAARAGEGYDEQVGEEARMEREREAAEVAATSLWRVVQDAGDRIRRGSVFLLERDRSQVFFARTSEAGLEFFSALAAAFSDAAGAVERGRKDDAWAAGNRAATMTAAAAAGAAGAAGVTQSGKKPALFTPGKFNEAQGDPSTGTGETAAVAAAAGSPFLPAYLTTPAPGTPTLSHFPSPSPFSTPSHFPPPAATSAAAATGVGVSASAAAAAARRHLARAATLVEAAVGSLGAADRYRTDKARWYPDLGRLAGSDLGGVRRAKGRGRKRRGGRGVGGVRGGRVRGGGGGGGIGDMWRWVERWEPWACSGAVRAALWSLVATLIQLESTAQWDEDQLSLLHRLSLSLSSLLLSAFATALEARDVAGKGEQEGEEEQQEREVLEKEYFWKRDFLLSVLVQRAIGAAEASEVHAPFVTPRPPCVRR